MNGTILLVNGPNLNMLGTREPEKYGHTTLIDITQNIEKIAGESGYKLLPFQSNSEGKIIDFIQQEGADAAGMILNAAAYTHTSVAIRDAILSVQIPFVEVHISNIFKRESFRQHSYLSDIAIGMVTGFGDYSYVLGIKALVNSLDKKNENNMK